MSVWFRLSKHKARPDTEIVEMFDGNRLLAVLEPLPMPLGVRMLSTQINKFAVAPPLASDRAVEMFEIFFTERH